MAVREHDGVWGGELKGWESLSIKKNYNKWLRREKAKERELLNMAEQMGVDVSALRRAIGH